MDKMKEYRDLLVNDMDQILESQKRNIETAASIMSDTAKENHKIYCDNCRQAVTAICYRCGTPFDMPYWMKKQIDERGKNTYCPDCRSSFRH